MNSIALRRKGLDERPVIIKFVGLKSGSNNAKTGNMIQSYIMPEDWVKKKRVGSDKSVCGDCVHSQSEDGDCYVRHGSAQMGLYATTKSRPGALYKELEELRFLMDLAPRISGRAVRFGTYGEPVLMGENVVRTIATLAKTHTGYTHQWRKDEYQWAKEFFMASVDSEEEAKEAQAMGWRTFRVRDAKAPIMPGETTCPASKEAGHKTVCAKCSLCSGTQVKAKNIVIINH